MDVQDGDVKQPERGQGMRTWVDSKRMGSTRDRMSPERFARGIRGGLRFRVIAAAIAVSGL